MILLKLSLSLVSRCIILLSGVHVLLGKAVVLSGTIVRTLLRKTIVLSRRIIGVGVLIWHIILGWWRVIKDLVRWIVHMGLDLRSLMG